MLARELVEQQPRDGGDSRVRILQASRHLRDVALHLHHVVEHEMRENRHRVLTNARVRVVKRVAPLPEAVEMLGPRLERVGEPEREVPERHHERGAGAAVGFAAEPGEDEREVVLAKGAVDGHQAGERGERGAAEQRVALGDGGMAAEGDDDGSVRRDDSLADVLGGFERQEFSLGELPGVVEVKVLGHGTLPERGGERSLLGVILALRGGGFRVLGSLAVAVDARAAHRASQSLDVDEVSKAHLAEDE